MIGKFYDFMYYRTHLMISKTNKLSPVSSSARLLGIGFLINMLTLFFFIENQLPKESFYIFFGVGVIGSLYIIYYFSSRKTYYIINGYTKFKNNKILNFLADYYFDLSLVLMMISAETDLNTLLYVVVILIIGRCVLYFANL